mgnify:CR=1 FL=1
MSEKPEISSGSPSMSGQYGQLSFHLTYQIGETKKPPNGGCSLISAVLCIAVCENDSCPEVLQRRRVALASLPVNYAQVAHVIFQYHL